MLKQGLQPSNNSIMANSSNLSSAGPPPAMASPSPTRIYTKKTLSQALISIKNQGWIPNTTGKSGDGVPGDILEALLGVPRNNLPIADASGWELKTHKNGSGAMVSLSHKEMKSDAVTRGVVPKMMLPIFGWPHQEAGLLYPATELSLRTDIVGDKWNGRGFKLEVNETEQRVYVAFDPSKVSSDNKTWKAGVEQKLQTIPFSEPYYDFSDFYKTIGRKFLNCFFVKFDETVINNVQHFQYTDAYILEDVDVRRFMKGIENGDVKIEYDARTGHNHGTKMRMFEDDIPDVYLKVTKIM